MSVAAVVGCLASALTLYSTVPQVLRAARTRSVEGLSWSSILLSLATFTLWVVYALSVADAIQIINNSLALVLLVALAVVVARTGISRATWVPVVVVFGTGLASLWLVDVANSFTLAMVGTAASSVRMFPQARLAVSGAPLGGLCPWSVLLAWWGTVLWLSYGSLVGDVAVVIVSVVLLSMQSVVLRYRLPARRTLASLAGGRLGGPVATLAAPLAARLPVKRDDVELAA